jgi:cyanophycinase
MIWKQSHLIEHNRYHMCLVPYISQVSLPGAVLIGGGEDPPDAFAWQIENARGGDFLILRAYGDDAYNPWIWQLASAIGHPLNSVTTLLFNERAASFDPAVVALIEGAEAIFFAGGDQSEYAPCKCFGMIRSCH